MKILKFGAEWCAPCRAMEKLLSEMELPYTVTSIDVDKHPGQASDFAIRSLPTLVLITLDGKEKGRLVGAKTKADIVEWVS